MLVIVNHARQRWYLTLAAGVGHAGPAPQLTRAAGVGHVDLVQHSAEVLPVRNGATVLVPLVVGVDVRHAHAQRVVGQHQEYLERQLERHTAILKDWGWAEDGYWKVMAMGLRDSRVRAD